MVLIVPDNVWQSVSFRKYKATYSIGSKTNVSKSRGKEEDKSKKSKEEKSKKKELFGCEKSKE